MMKRILSFVLSVVVCITSALLLTGRLVNANNNGEDAITVLATIQPQRIIVVDKNLTITSIFSNTALDVRPFVLLDSLDGKEIPYSESVAEQYLVEKESLDFSQPALFDISSEAARARNKNNVIILVIVALGFGALLGALVMTIRKIFFLKRLATLLSLVCILFAPLHLHIFAQGTDSPVQLASTGLITRVASGELFPVSVKLLNFGGDSRVDMLVVYTIVSSDGEVMYSTEETVAVETTASYVKLLQVPATLSPGTYTAKTAITYKGQLVPATTQFPFQIERKIFGLFQSDFYLYGGIATSIGIFSIFLGRVFIRNRRSTRFQPHDYSSIAKDVRVFYELISDTIHGMRERVGDDALAIASHIPGLTIDLETGRVLALAAQPSKIIATLVFEYEKLLGKKVSFSFRREKV